MRYLPLRENLLKQMYALHSYAHMPKVIVVEGMEQYCQVTQKEKEKEENPVELYGAMVCASLIDAIGVCAKSCNSSAQLIVSLVHNPDQWASYKTLIDLFFHDVVWFVSNVQEAGVVEEEKIVANQVTSAVEKRKSRVEFVPIASEGTLVLKAIMRMFDTQK
ncbi:uncharacterized protein [Anabrus simplex]|uniref:uncharacterized protein isoform X2 n=1 Tax=Anabrus simplex TaxID=316456 RepID=UPI0034DDAD79